MGVHREYTTAQALKILNQSEGLVVRNRMRRPAAGDESPAHAFSSHLAYGGNYGKGSGYAPMSPSAGLDGIKDRFLANPVDGQGAPIVSSGWYRKGDMAVRLLQVLNSATGQEALRTMDRGVTRTVVHCRNREKGGLLDPAHASGSYKVTPEHTVTETQAIHNTKTGAFIKNIEKKRTVPRSVASSLGKKDVVGIHAVLEKFGGGDLHVQTLFPSAALDLECFEYRLGTIEVLCFQLDNGSFVTKMTPR